MREAQLVAEWHAVQGGTAASLIGVVDADALQVIVNLRSLADDASQLVIDLEHVDAIDGAGVALLEALGAEHNVLMVNPSNAIVTALVDLDLPRL